MKKALYPGTFDPITYGHINIIDRALEIFDSLVIGVFKNPSKNTLFSYRERIELVKKVLKDKERVEVMGFDGLLVDFARKLGAKVIVRGLRMFSDFEYEFQMALFNRELDNTIDTVFLMTSSEYAFLSSRLVKEIFKFRGNLHKLLPEPVILALKKKIYESRGR